MALGSHFKGVIASGRGVQLAVEIRRHWPWKHCWTGTEKQLRARQSISPKQEMRLLFGCVWND